MPLSEIEIDLPWLKVCLIYEISTIPRVPRNADADPTFPYVEAIQTTTFEINNAESFVSVTFSITVTADLKKIQNNGSKKQLLGTNTDLK